MTIAINLHDVLSESDFQLVHATRPAELRELDEDALLDLHARVRRARNKHVGVYRREAAARVVRKGARGAARPANVRNATRAEVFEDALARVSRQHGVAARQSALELKELRLAQATGAPAKKAPAKTAAKKSVKAAPKAAAKKPVTTDQTRANPGRIKREAGTKAAGARRQAKRDAR